VTRAAATLLLLLELSLTAPVAVELPGHRVLRLVVTGDAGGTHSELRDGNYLLRSKLADFVMLDTQPIALGFATPIAGSATAREEASWLAAALDRLPHHWRIVVGHHTIYSSGMHGRRNDGFAVLELSQDHLAITFYDRSGRRTAGPFLTTRHR